MYVNGDFAGFLSVAYGIHNNLLIEFTDLQKWIGKKDPFSPSYLKFLSHIEVSPMPLRLQEPRALWTPNEPPAERYVRVRSIVESEYTGPCVPPLEPYYSDILDLGKERSEYINALADQAGKHKKGHSAVEAIPGMKLPWELCVRAYNIISTLIKIGQRKETNGIDVHRNGRQCSEEEEMRKRKEISDFVNFFKGYKYLSDTKLKELDNNRRNAQKMNRLQEDQYRTMN